MKKPIIIDTDPGLDDAIALLMAFQYEGFDIKAITTVAGNQTLDKTSANALRLVEYAGFDIPVAKGAEKPLFRPLVTAEHVHGASGLGTVVLPEAKGNFCEEKAWDLIYKEAIKADGKLTVIALGPLTNIAATLGKYPDFKNHLDELILMGGSCGYGNDTPAAEYNIYADPEAARIVFDSGLNITMVGLDATHKALLFPSEMEEIRLMGNRGSEVAYKVLEYYWNFFHDRGFGGVIMHDPFAVACAMDKSLLKSEEYHVDVETRGTYTQGKTVVDIYKVTGKKPNAKVGVDIERQRFVDLLKGLMGKYGQ